MIQNTENETELEKIAREKKENRNKRIEKIKEIAIVAGSGILILATWWGSGFWINENINPDYRGIVGDMFGAVNALFSGLAFAGLIYTITVQRKELSLQREAIQMQTKELEAQHIETSRSADQLQIQQELMNYQLVLATVNDLVKLKNSLAEEVKKTYRNHTDNIFYRWSANIKELNKLVRFPDELKDVQKNLKQYEESYFFLLQFVLDSKLPEEQTRNLKQIIKINMSDDEINILTHKALQEGNQHRLALLKTFDIIQ